MKNVFRIDRFVSFLATEALQQDRQEVVKICLTGNLRLKKQNPTKSVAWLSGS